MEMLRHLKDSLPAGTGRVRSPNLHHEVVVDFLEATPTHMYILRLLPLDIPLSHAGTYTPGEIHRSYHLTLPASYGSRRVCARARALQLGRHLLQHSRLTPSQIWGHGAIH